MNTEQFYKELSLSDNQEQVIERYITDALIKKETGKSCESTRIFDCDKDENDNFTIIAYVECDGHGDTEYNDSGDYQDDDGDNFDTTESRGRVTIYLSSDSAEWEFEAD